MKKSKPTVILIILSGVIALGIGAFYAFSDNNETSTSIDGTNSKNCTTYNNVIAEQCAEDYVGLAREEAVNRAEKNGLVPKVVKVDDEDQGFTDFGSTPIYFEVENGSITKAYFEDDRPAFE